MATLLEAGFGDACQIGQFLAKEAAAELKSPALVIRLRVY
jgi:hypothetical protein